MSHSIQALIIEDDFRIAEINRRYVEKVEGYTVQKVVKTGEEALAYLKTCASRPQLILLDIYIPDVKGLELLWQIRHLYHAIDLIPVTAANETGTIEEALRGGAFDYIVKPVDADRFAQSLERYKEYRKFLSAKASLEQNEIDTLIGATDVSYSFHSSSANMNLPKGIDPITLNDIKQLLEADKGKGITAVELSKKIGTSRSTARRYLEYLVSAKEVYTTLKYGTVGRPEREYMRRETYEQND
ncbi:response regulator [Oceanobacillus neutriphilus]|uniref:Two-component system response regulator n=1 Tax=Oceanobacillus neutriphilus TaxID=531815 RepID=A0ABQ2NXM4_9BACI|nr:response regulator [Oceanobacillus neutriphilus]GGP13091.1 two-component system response regulator [Oceanobacillus neutriphilus]